MFAKLNDDVLFGKVWSDDTLTLKMRSALTTMTLVAKDSWMSHVAFEACGTGMSNEWCEPVSDKEYLKL